MAQKGIKQRTLADAMGIDESQISVMKRGNRDLKISEVENIASCLGVSITDFVHLARAICAGAICRRKRLNYPKSYTAIGVGR